MTKSKKGSGMLLSIASIGLATVVASGLVGYYGNREATTEKIQRGDAMVLAEVNKNRERIATLESNSASILDGIQELISRP